LRGQTRDILRLRGGGYQPEADMPVLYRPRGKCHDRAVIQLGHSLLLGRSMHRNDYSRARNRRRSCPRGLEYTIRVYFGRWLYSDQTGSRTEETPPPVIQDQPISRYVWDSTKLRCPPYSLPLLTLLPQKRLHAQGQWGMRPSFDL
jgi:hypothetical protein